MEDPHPRQHLFWLDANSEHTYHCVSSRVPFRSKEQTKVAREKEITDALSAGLAARGDWRWDRQNKEVRVRALALRQPYQMSSSLSRLKNHAANSCYETIPLPLFLSFPFLSTSSVRKSNLQHGRSATAALSETSSIETCKSFSAP